MPVERMIKNKAFKPPSRASGGAAPAASTSRAKGAARGRGRPPKSATTITASSDDDDHISDDDHDNGDDTREIANRGTASDSEGSPMSDVAEAAITVSKSRKRKSSESEAQKQKQKQKPSKKLGPTTVKNGRDKGGETGKRGRPRLHGSDNPASDLEQSVNNSDDDGSNGDNNDVDLENPDEDEERDDSGAKVNPRASTKPRDLNNKSLLHCYGHCCSIISGIKSCGSARRQVCWWGSTWRRSSRRASREPSTKERKPGGTAQIKDQATASCKLRTSKS